MIFPNSVARHSSLDSSTCSLLRPLLLDQDIVEVLNAGPVMLQSNQ